MNDKTNIDASTGKYNKDLPRKLQYVSTINKSCFRREKKRRTKVLTENGVDSKKSIRF